MPKDGWMNITNIKDLDMEDFKKFIITCVVIGVLTGAFCTLCITKCTHDVNLSEIPSNDPKFESVQEELDSLHSWNELKLKLIHELTECVDIVEQITYDTFDCEDSITIDDFIDVLEDRGYYYHLNNVDNLYRNNI